MIWLALWWLVGAVSMGALYYREMRRKWQVDAREIALCLLWTLAGPILPLLMLYVLIRTRQGKKVW